MSRRSPLSIIVPIVLIVGLVAAVMLVKRSQELRRGAYFAGTNLLLQPTDQTKAVGANVPIQVYVDTQTVGSSGEKAKVDFVKTRVCVSDQLSLGSNVGSSIDINTAAFDLLLIGKLAGDAPSGQICVDMSIQASKPKEQLMSGMVKVATINFTAAKVGEGTASIVKEKSQISGYNPAAGSTDMAMQIGTVTGAAFTVTEGDGPTNTPVPSECSADSDCMWCGVYCVPKESTNPGICEQISPPENSECVCLDNKCIGIGGPDPTETPVPTEVPQPTDTPEPTQPPTGSPILKYTLAFADVAWGAVCAVNWPVRIIVLANGETKTYSNVIPVKSEGEGDYQEYSGSLALADFNHTNNIAVFIKGPKHLQMKYGINNQSGPYNQAGGEISLSRDEATSPRQDFSAFAMLAGDVTNEAGGGQDGMINGLDFSFVKSRSLTHETVGEGEYLPADLDGNCQLNSNDVNVLKKSLKEKQDQLY